MRLGLLILSLCLSFQAQAKFGDFLNDLFGGGRDDVTTSEDVAQSNDEVRIVIDRNPKVQQMKVYMEGQELPSMTFNISTGREIFDFPNNFKKNPECVTTPLSAPGKPYEMGALYEMYRSDTWLHKNEATGIPEGSAMPHAMQVVNGIYMHATTAIDGLGPKNTPREQAKGGSGGCIRMHPCDAETLFNLFAQTRKLTAEEKRSTPATTDSDQTCPEVSLPRGKTYDRVSAESRKTCNNSSAPRCTDPNLFPIRPNGRKANISVIDTRTPEELQKVADACKRDTDRHKERKAKCLLDKVVANIESTGGSYDKALVDSDPAARGKFLSDSLKGLTDRQRSDFNMECNKEIYYEKMASKCKLRKFQALNKGLPNDPDLEPNQGMYNMEKLNAYFAAQKASDNAKFDQACSAEVASLMYVSPSDPAPRPDEVPIPRLRPTR